MTNYELIDLMVCLATCVYFARLLLGAGFGPGPSSRDAGATKASLAYRAGMAWLACFDRSGRPKEPRPAREPLGTSSGPPLDPLWTPFCPSADVFWTRFLLGLQAPISAYFTITYAILLPFESADKSSIGHFVPGGPGELRGVAGRMIELGKAVAIGGRRSLPRLWRSTRQYTAPPQPSCPLHSISTTLWLSASSRAGAPQLSFALNSIPDSIPAAPPRPAHHPAPRAYQRPVEFGGFIFFRGPGALSFTASPSGKSMQVMTGVREFVESTSGRVVTGGLIALAGLGIVRSCRANFCYSPAIAASRQRSFVCAQTNKVFQVELVKGMKLPVRSPFSGQDTGYEADEVCSWTTAGQVSAEPTYVLLNSTLGKKGPTFCPACGRLVVRSNPPAEEGKAPPPTQQEYRSRRP